MKISAGVVIIYDNKVLLCHPTNASKYNSYSFPKGGVNDKEGLISAAIRECLEETGIKIEESQISKTFLVEYTKKNSALITKKVHLFLVKINSLEEVGLDSEVVPKSSLQLEEVDWAGFLTKDQCADKVFWRFKFIVEEVLK